jgi:hypothetical protein
MEQAPETGPTVMALIHGYAHPTAWLVGRRHGADVDLLDAYEGEKLTLQDVASTTEQLRARWQVTRIVCDSTTGRVWETLRREYHIPIERTAGPPTGWESTGRVAFKQTGIITLSEWILHDGLRLLLWPEA